MNTLLAFSILNFNFSYVAASSVGAMASFRAPYHGVARGFTCDTDPGCQNMVKRFPGAG